MRVGWLWVSATAKSELLQTAKFLLPYATKLPTSPSHATLRAHLGRFPSCSRWGPHKKGLQGLAAPPFSAGGGRKRAAWRHRLQFPGPRLTLKWERAGKLAWRSRTCIVPRCHLRKLFVHLTWKAIHSRWGGGLRGRLYTQRLLSGAVGQVGAVLSAPVAQPPPQMSMKPPAQTCRVASPWSLYSRISGSWHRMKSGSQEDLPALPFPYAPPASETSSSAAPTTQPPSLGAANAQLAKSLLPYWQAGFLSLARGKGGWREVRGLGNK